MPEAVLTLEVLDKCIKLLEPVRHPKRMYISQEDYELMRQSCDKLGILPELAKNISPGFGMEIRPSGVLGRHEYYFEYERGKDEVQKETSSY